MPRLPSAEDVPTVSPKVTADPGVKAPAHAFESPVGVAAEEFAPAVEKYAQVARLQEDRKNIVDMAEQINTKNMENDEKLRDLNAKSDLSREDVLSEYGAFLVQRRQELLNLHRERGGSQDSLARLQVRLMELDDRYTGQAAGISAKIGKDKVDTAYNNALTPLAERAAQNPTLENINVVLGDLRSQFDDLKGGYDPIEEGAKLRAGEEHIAINALNKLIINGRAETAQGLLEEGNLAQYLSPESQRSVRRSIETVLSSKEEMTRKIQQAEVAIGRRLSQDERLRLIGLGTKESLTTKEVFNVATGKLQFATEAQIAADPNLVPKETAKPEKFTPAQFQAAGFAARTEEADKIIGEVGGKFTGFESRISGSAFFPRELQSEDRIKFDQAKRNFVNSVLRRESGAAIAKSEFDNAEQQYFPVPGDTESVMTQKQQNRNMVIQALKLEAGDAFKQLKTTIPQTVKIKGQDYIVGTIVTNKKGQRGRIEQNGSITIFGNK